MSTNKQPLTLRIEENIFVKIKQIAEKERRSLNSQIETAIERYIQDYEKQNGLIKN
jgi:hypothetical protein